MRWFTWSALVVAVTWSLCSAPAEGANVTFNARTVRSGVWSNPRTWADGRVPKAGDAVQIRQGDAVVYDLSSDDAIRMIHVAGVLRFSRTMSTKLCVGLIKVQAGDKCSEEGFDCDAHGAAGAGDAPDSPRPVLEIGSDESPIPANITATIKLVYFEGMDKQTLPAIINCGGRWDVHGAPMARTWLKLKETAKAGSETVTLSETPTGWRDGDRIVLTSSKEVHYYSKKQQPVGREERVIKALSGAELRLDKALEADHVAEGPEVTEAANLSRNVIIESADPAGVRGHTMYHRNSTGGISYAEFRHLGKSGVLGKYPIHFHLVRGSMRGSGVIGASIWDSHNRFMAIHGTDYLLVRDCVGYNCLGHGYFLDDATEQYNVLDRNIAIAALRARKLPKQALDFDNNDGAGFWWANGRNTFTRNVACENQTYGFLFEIAKSRGKAPILNVLQPDGGTSPTDVRTIPFLRFEDNESHCDGLYAFKFGDDPAGSIRSDTRHPFIARNLRVWQAHYCLRSNTQTFLMDGLTINDGVYGVYHPDYADHVYRNIYLNHVNEEPINRGHDDESFQIGSFTYENLTFENCKSGRDPLIQVSCTSPNPGQSGHFRNVIIKNSSSRYANVVDLGGGPRNDKLENVVPYYFHDMPQAGITTKVVSVHFPEAMNDGLYRSIPHFTGPDVRATEIREVPFPVLLDPVDDLPPATIITSVRRAVDGTLLVSGVSHDNGEVAAVTVNGKPATIVASHAGVADWKITIGAGAATITAFATDAAGNVEKMPAVRKVDASPSK
jgi:hypothetical protein